MRTTPPPYTKAPSYVDLNHESEPEQEAAILKAIRAGGKTGAIFYNTKNNHRRIDRIVSKAPAGTTVNRTRGEKNKTIVAIFTPPPADGQS
jgi:hypothetical protein